MLSSLPAEADDAVLKRLLSQCGSVLSWMRPVLGDDRRAAPFGFAEFSAPQAALAALRVLPGLDLGNGTLAVKAGEATRARLDAFLDSTLLPAERIAGEKPREDTDGDTARRAAIRRILELRARERDETRKRPRPDADAAPPPPPPKRAAASAAPEEGELPPPPPPPPPLDWPAIEAGGRLEKAVRPWVASFVEAYFGEGDAVMVEHVMGLLRARPQQQAKVVAAVRELFESESDAFVADLWRELQRQ